MSEIRIPEFAGDIDEGSLSRIKTELDPGERLLWASRPHLKTVAISWGFPTAGLIAAIFFFPGLVFLRLSFQPGLAPNEKLVVPGVFCWALACFIALGMIVSRRDGHAQASRRDNTLYALSNRRAMAWIPHIKKGAVEVISIYRGECLRLSRVEYVEGNGDVLFRSRVKGEYQDFDRNEFAGFEGVEDVRRVEELVRRTLFSDIEA